MSNVIEPSFPFQQNRYGALHRELLEVLNKHHDAPIGLFITEIIGVLATVQADVIDSLKD